MSIVVHAVLYVGRWPVEHLDVFREMNENVVAEPVRLRSLPANHIQNNQNKKHIQESVNALIASTMSDSSNSITRADELEELGALEEGQDQNDRQRETPDSRRPQRVSENAELETAAEERKKGNNAESFSDLDELEEPKRLGKPADTSNVDDLDSFDDLEKELDKANKEEEDEDALLGVTTTRPTRSRSSSLVDITTSRTRTKSIAHDRGSSSTRIASSTAFRDKADDQLNSIMKSKHGPLETKWIILIVAIGTLLFTAMATAAFIRRRFNRAKLADLKKAQEEEDLQRQAALQQQRNMEEYYEEEDSWQQPRGDRIDDWQRGPDVEMARADDIYHMNDRKPFRVV